MIDRIKRVHVFEERDPEAHFSNQTLLGVQGNIPDKIFIGCSPAEIGIIDTLVITTENDFIPMNKAILVNSNNDKEKVLFEKVITVLSEPKVYIFKKI